MPPLRKRVPGQLRHAVQTLTVSGDIALTSGVARLSHASVIIAATLNNFQPGDGFLIVNDSASGTAAHTVTLPSGVTWNGANRVATLDAPGEALLVECISPTRFLVLANIGAVAFSG